MPEQKIDSSKDGIDPVDSHVGRRLRHFRTKMGLSLDSTAKQIGTTYQQLQKYETGANRISCSRLYKICKVYGIEIMDVYHGLPDLHECSADKLDESLNSLSRIDVNTRYHLLRLLEVLVPPE